LSKEKRNSMNTFKKALFHYFVGVLISASIVFLVIVFDYFFNGYCTYPQLDNFIMVCLISGIGFGFTHFAFTIFNQSKKTNLTTTKKQKKTKKQ
jgi:hypothetical protein